MAIRRDAHVPNESDGFVFTSRRERAAGLSPGEAAWSAAVAAGRLLPLEVESEDPANVRVVVGGPLEPAEEAEWVGRLRARLVVPDGRLVLAGGIEYVAFKGAAEDAREIDVPAGEYIVTLYCYASAPNGRACLERAGLTEPLGAWFRRSRPGMAPPPWLHNLCVSDPALDPGHEARWRRAGEKRGAVVDFLLHLVPGVGEAAGAPPDPGGFLSPTECRRPEPFPLGVPVVSVEGGDEAEVDETPPRPVLVDVGSKTASLDRRPIEGGPVALPLVKLARLARLAWLCHPYTQPLLRLRYPGKPGPMKPVDGAVVTTRKGERQVAFDDTGQPSGALAALTAVARQLADAPDGTGVELDTSRRSTHERLGLHRYRGTVRGGVLHVDEAFPAVSAAVLGEALALAEALENGRRLTARDEPEAVRIEARVRERLSDLFGANTLQRNGAEIGLQRRDPVLFEHVVGRVFWSRYAGTWPLVDQDAP